MGRFLAWAVWLPTSRQKVQRGGLDAVRQTNDRLEPLV
jgi:hypothetical protein